MLIVLVFPTRNFEEKKSLFCIYIFFHFFHFPPYFNHNFIRLDFKIQILYACDFMCDQNQNFMYLCIVKLFFDGVGVVPGLCYMTHIF